MTKDKPSDFKMKETPLGFVDHWMKRVKKIIK